MNRNFAFIVAGLFVVSVSSTALLSHKADTQSAQLAAAAQTQVAVCSGISGPSVRSTTDLQDDSSDYQIHVMYVLPSDGIDHQYDTNGAIARSVSSWEHWICRQTGGKGLKLDTRNGQLDVTFLRLNLTDKQIMTGADLPFVASTTANGFIRDDLEWYLRKAGLIQPNKLYAIYYDGHSNWSCGAGAWPPNIPGQVAAAYLQGGKAGDLPCEKNLPIGYSTTTPSYLDFDILHETMHTLGFAPATAPHHTLAGHVLDTPADLMQAGKPWGIPNLVLDYHHDDYYQANIPNSLDLQNSAFFMGGGTQLPPKWGQSSISVTPTATIDPKSLISTDGVVTITGTSSNSQAVFGVLVPASHSGSKDWTTIYDNQFYVAFSGPDTSAVLSGKWSVSFRGLIPNGTYTVVVYHAETSVVYDSANVQKLLTSGTLTVTGSNLSGSPFTLLKGDNVYLAKNFYGSFESGHDVNVIALTKAFYKYYPDTYDFIAIFTDLSGNGSDGEATVKNPTQGLGYAFDDSSTIFGSSGMLKAYMLIHARPSLDNRFTFTDLAHEVAHYWLAHLQSETIPFKRDFAHWSPWFDNAVREGSCMYHAMTGGGAFVDNGNGTFSPDSRPTCVTGYSSMNKANTLDLYLMGLIPASQVQPLTLWIPTDTNASPSATSISGTKKIVTIADVIKIAGQRNPAYPNTQKNFKVAYIYLAKGIPSDWQIGNIKWVSDEFPKYWNSVVTSGLSTLNSIGSIRNTLTATIATSSLTSTSNNPTITGTAANIASVQLDVRTNPPEGKLLFLGLAPVVNGRWSITLAPAVGRISPPNFANGTYSVAVRDRANNNLLATGTLTVSSTPTSTLSPDGSTLLPGTTGSLTTVAGKWTFSTSTNSGGNLILLNAKSAANGAALSLLVSQGGKMFAHSANTLWYLWNGAGWRITSNPTTSASTVPGSQMASVLGGIKETFLHLMQTTFGR